ncbi:MAG: hypothetical protein ACSHWW_12760 [Nonlabens sp.]|uniref:hypothetical protein n=1 Tax=Nonlabens sp. TaxID=1888209 RepID=UPI003EFAF7F0
MESIISIKKEINSLESLHTFIDKQTPYECIIDYDIWDVRSNAQNQMEKCMIIKKNSMNAVKLYFLNDNKVKLDHIIPNKMMNVYFGKRHRVRQNILEFATTKIKDSLLAAPQHKAFKEIEIIVLSASS